MTSNLIGKNDKNKNIYILGISAFYHDSAAALLKNGKIVSAVQEERFSRIKHDKAFPLNSINFILREEKISLDEIDHIVFYEKPNLKFNRIVSTILMFAPKGFSNFAKIFKKWLINYSTTESIIKKELNKIKKIDKKINFIEHHLSHAASAFYPSPFEEAAILTIDGVGEWSTTTLSVGKKNLINITHEIKFPHSIGLLYSAFTYYLGFKVNSGEYKVMGLAPYGKPIYEEVILKNLIDLKDDGSFRLNLDYFDYTFSNKMFNEKFERLFNLKKRKPESEINQIHKDIAASIQSVINKIVLKIALNIKKTTNQKNLCLAGGVALNCVANGKLIKENYFENIWIQPAAGDAGGALGAAYEFWYSNLKNDRKIDKIKDSMSGSYLGPKFNDDEIFNSLKKLNAKFSKLEDRNLINFISQKISEQKCIGWFQGRMEFGPRALGSRSILADPRDGKMQKNLNTKIKFRESFRPFAPCIPVDDLNDWFDLNTASPYMLLVAEVLDKHIKDDKTSLIPAVTHIDYSARIQTVDKISNSRLYDLLKKFKEITGCPILINTSFNLRGEPMVCTVEDAFRTFMISDLDYLICENFLLAKDEQIDRENYLKSYTVKLD